MSTEPRTIGSLPILVFRKPSPKFFHRQQETVMPRYRAAAAVFLKPDDHAGARRIEAGEAFVYSGTPSMVMVPLDVAARAAKRRLLPDAWPVSASPSHTMRVGLGLGAHVTTNLAERRRIIEDFINSNPVTEESAA